MFQYFVYYILLYCSQKAPEIVALKYDFEETFFCKAITTDSDFSTLENFNLLPQVVLKLSSLDQVLDLCAHILHMRIPLLQAFKRLQVI